MKSLELKFGTEYKWKCQSDRIIYTGRDGAWHQFEKVGEFGVVWCEMLDEDLHLIELSITSDPASIGGL